MPVLVLPMVIDVDDFEYGEQDETGLGEYQVWVIAQPNARH
jgi:hypothetical protein